MPAFTGTAARSATSSRGGLMSGACRYSVGASPSRTLPRATVARGKVREGDAPTLYLHAPDAKVPRELAADRAPVAVKGGVFDLDAVLALLAQREVNEVHVETGATLAGALLKAGLVDDLLLYVAPVLLGDTARPLFGGLDLTRMAQCLRMEIVETVRVGDDLRLHLRPGAQPAAAA